MQKNIILHTFGDSHCRYPWEKVQLNGLTIKIHNFAAVTCASFGFQKLDVLNIKNKRFNVKNNEIILFSFGHIDCACHICKPHNLEIYKELIDKIVLEYFEAIKLNVQQYKNLNVIVFNVVPQCRFNDEMIEKYGPNGTRKYPFFGTNEERKTATLYFNKKIKELCSNNKYIFFDIYDKYCDDEGYLWHNNYYCADNHIQDPKYVEEELKKILNF
jgi:hypothetical protein